MKIGTDAIILSSLVPNINPKTVLDIGTGCGIIALCMAQKYHNSQITAIDIDNNSIEEANYNFLHSKYASRIILKEIDILTFSKEKKETFDLIITNPPYFISSLESPFKNRTQARHTSSLSFENLIKSIQNLLSKDGILCLILPKKESEIFEEIAEKRHLYTIKKIKIYSKPQKECERIVLHLKLRYSNISSSTSKLIDIEENIITLRNIDNSLSQEYINLVEDYLL